MDTANYNKDIDAYLVSLLEKHPCIYDRRNVDYKECQRKQESWDAIAGALNMDADIVKKRWENLRDRFVRVYREYTALGNCSTVRGKFKLFDQMLWLAPHLRKRRMTSSIFIAKNKMPPTLFHFDCEDTKSSETPDNVNVKAETQSNTSDRESFMHDEPLSSTSTRITRPSDNETIPNKSDHHFMMSIVHDCQSMSPKKKFMFKKEVLELLEKYMFDDTVK